LPPQRETDESDLSLLAQTIRRRLWVVVVCVVLATVAAIGLTVTAEKEYSATAALLLRSSAAVDPQRAVDTNLQLLSLPQVAERAAEELSGMSGEEVSAAVETKQQGESDIIEVTAVSSDAQKAADIANGFAAAFVSFRGEGNREGQQTGRVELVERATPDDNPISPKPLRNIVFGLAIGLVLGIALALLLEQLDRRVKREEDLTEATGLPKLAVIPKRKSFDRQHLGHAALSPAETEVFRMLRANLRYFNAQKQIKSVLVTSAEAGEGKSLVSLGLALAAVTSGERVLLLEADLRDPGLSKVLGLDAVGGLSGLLSGDAAGALEDAVTTVPAEKLADAVGAMTLDVIPAGAIPPNPTELVESERMKELIGKAEEKYDFVIIDTPPVLVVADAIPLIFDVSGVLVVSGLGVSTRNSAADLAEQLERLKAPTLGLVANFAEHTGRSYEGYGYGRAPDADLIRSGGSSGSAASADDQ
jgi:capsular exopolysaccharide synthesis family protein